MALAGSLRLTSTPAFLLGRVAENRLRVSRVILGARPAAEFEAAIEETIRTVPEKR
jgi:hypothetical protein